MCPCRRSASRATGEGDREEGETMTEQNRTAWGSRVGVIFAVMGSAIGLGNFLRFPGMAAKYEGGTFMIPYFVSFLVLGLPIAWMEWAMGRYGGMRGFNSSPGIFRVVWKSRLSPYLGVLGLIIPVGIYMYYVFIESWCLYYAVQYLLGDMRGAGDAAGYMALFSSYTGMGKDGVLFQGASQAIWYLLVAFVINFIIIYRGVNHGIELVSRYAIPLLFVSALVVLVRVLTLGTPDPSLPERNVLNGLGSMWNPGGGEKSLWESLLNAQMWLEAASQIFFSLSVGFGIIVTYASYLRREDDVVLSGTSSASGNVFAEVALGGLITIPAGFIFLGPGGGTGGTFQLGFVTLPFVFEHMPLGQFFGFLWFFLLFIAAITSSISMLQPAIAFFEEGLGTGRKASVTLLGLITLMGSLFILYFSAELKALDAMDFWVGSFLIYLLAMLEVLVFGWIFGAEEVIQEANEGSLLKIPGWAAFVIKYVSSFYLLAVFLTWAYQNVPVYVKKFNSDEVTRNTIGFIVMVIAFFLVLIMTAVNRWNKKERGGIV